ncbi:DUF1610 domain-containing protein [Candidatus Woesearchaeota archaeon]|nr:DUF1610 domain-containing protein [Candidatus Woesearchaeota archaeon]
MAGKKCTSCNKIVTNDRFATNFPCPECGKETIVRCGKCRRTSAKYPCSECEFIGP